MKKFINCGRTIRELIKRTTLEFPENSAFKVKNKKKEISSISYKALTEDIRNLGTEMLALGLGNEPIGIIGENSYEWFNVFLGIASSGAIAVPFDKGFTEEELASCIKRSRLKAIFHDEGHSNLVNGAFSLLKEEYPESSEIKRFVINSENSELNNLREAGKAKLLAGDKAFDEVKIDENAKAVILFTSGTTSSSKAVMLSNRNITSNIEAMQNYESFYNQDVNIAFLPFHHSFGLVGVLVFLASGACNVFCDGLKYVTKNLEEYGVTVFVGVPLLVESMYKKIKIQVKKSGLEGKVNMGIKLSKILRAVGIDARRKIFKEIIDKLGGKLRLIISGAAPLAPEVANGFNNFGITLLQGYGLTETSPVLAAEAPHVLCAGSVGKPLPGIEITIEEKDENGIGEIVAKGPNVMLGYMDQEEETNEVIIDGRFHTGDLGKFDNKGHLWIMGRKKNVIVMKNGKNVFPEEIEENIGLLPYVAENMIFTRDKHNEHVLWAKIVYRPEFLEEESLEFEDFAKRVSEDLGKINDTMPSYKSVKHFILDTEGMIKTTTQKVKRKPEVEKINANKDNEMWFTVS